MAPCKCTGTDTRGRNHDIYHIQITDATQQRNWTEGRKQTHRCQSRPLSRQLLPPTGGVLLCMQISKRRPAQSVNGLARRTCHMLLLRCWSWQPTLPLGAAMKCRCHCLDLPSAPLHSHKEVFGALEGRHGTSHQRFKVDVVVLKHVGQRTPRRVVGADARHELAQGRNRNRLVNQTTAGECCCLGDATSHLAHSTNGPRKPVAKLTFCAATGVAATPTATVPRIGRALLACKQRH